MNTQSDSTNSEHSPSQRLYMALKCIPSICSKCVDLFSDLDEDLEWTEELRRKESELEKSGFEIPNRIRPLDNTTEERRHLNRILRKGIDKCYLVQDAIDAGGGDCVDAALNPGAATWSIGLRAKALDGAEEVLYRLAITVLGCDRVPRSDVARMGLFGGIYQKALMDLEGVLAKEARKATQQAQHGDGESHETKVRIEYKPSETEKRDDKDFIIKPLNPTDYGPKKEILESCPPGWEMTDKKLTRILDALKDVIRQCRPVSRLGLPNPRRRSIHRGDWARVCERIQISVDSGITGKSSPYNPTNSEIEQLKAEIRAENDAAKRDKPGE